MRYYQKVPKESVALGLAAAIALLEGAFLMKNELRPTIALMIVFGGAGAALLVWHLLPRRWVRGLVIGGLVAPWAVIYAAFWAQLAGRSAAGIVFYAAGVAVPFAVATLAVLAAMDTAVGHSRVGQAVVTGLALVACVLAAGARAPWLNDPRPPARFHLVDEVAGTYGGVGIDDSPQQMKAVFGPNEPLGESDRFEPTGSQDFTESPWSVTAGGGFAYADVLFWLPGNGTSPELATNGPIIGFEVTSPGVETTRGVGIGNDLSEARRSYSEFECGEADHGEYGTSKYCLGRIAPDRYLYFGGDPISSISVSRREVSP
ncbi:MAG: hypothetical protein ABI649_01460 [Gaiellaceae bacterium]